ncbi:M23 family metallopeptidase [Streptomyces sp. SBT349]|uniref:M23 family metallopeptidase n=1 Tax=Streptomyces sp. SBT349 TaxID=1580539 RepID=UPI000A459350|nr:M23 family metallopeptidase [Streptomyces sp. SBT349]
MITSRVRRFMLRSTVTTMACGAFVAGLMAAPAGAQPLTGHQAAAEAAVAGACPASGRISQGYHSNHDGIDIANSLGTPIHAADAGTVTHSGPASGYGQWIRIRHADGSVTEYGHMYQRDVAVGASVGAGQRIALMGSEGQSTGPHLHFEVHLDGAFGFGDDPIAYMSARGVALPC